MCHLYRQNLFADNSCWTFTNYNWSKASVKSHLGDFLLFSRKSARNQGKEHWQTISLPRHCEFQMPDSTYLAGPFPYHFLLLRWLLISLQETFFHHIQSFLLISVAELYDRCAKNKRGFSLDGWKSKEFMPLSPSQ